MSVLLGFFFIVHQGGIPWRAQVHPSVINDHLLWSLQKGNL